MSEFRLSLAKKLKMVRQSIRITQSEAAQVLNLAHPKAISMIESGERTISAEELLVLSKFYQKDIRYFLGAEYIEDTFLKDIIDAYHLCPEEKRKYFSLFYQLAGKGIASLEHKIFDNQDQEQGKDTSKILTYRGKTKLPYDIQLMKSSPGKLFVIGNHSFYRHNHTSYLGIIDISSLASPIVLNPYAYQLNASVLGFEVYLNLIYLVKENGIEILDKSDLNNIKSFKKLTKYKNALCMAVKGNKMVIATQYSSSSSLLIEIDLTNPVEPITVNKLELPCLPESLFISKDIIFATSSNHGIYIVKSDSQQDLSIISRYDKIETPFKLTVPNIYGYSIALVNCLYNETKLIDFSNLNNIKLITTIKSGLSYECETIPGKAFVSGRGLTSVDISNPACPLIEEIQSGLSISRNIVISGEYLYISEISGDIKIFKIRAF